MGVEEFLQNHWLFSVLPEEALKKLAATAVFRTFSPEEIVLEKNQHLTGFYLILSGTLRLALDRGPARETAYVFLSAGDSVGETGWVDPTTYSTELRAPETTQIAMLAFVELDLLLQPDAATHVKALQAMCVNLVHRVRG